MINQCVVTQFASNLRFKNLCVDILSRNYPFTTEQIIKYKEILNFSRTCLMQNPNINWDLNTVNKTKEKIEWSGFYNVNGIELNIPFFKTYEKYINFKSIYLNKNIDWSNQLVDTYHNRWEWEGLMMKPIVALPRNISKYKDKYNWRDFSSNRYLKLTEELLDKYIDKWNWSKLCSNESFKIDKKGIEKYKEHIDFISLSRNHSMVPFILAYSNDYDWSWRAFIQNPAVVFSDKLIQFLIEKFKKEHPYLKGLSPEMKTNYARSRMVSTAINWFDFDKDIWFSEAFKNHISWKEIIERKPEVLTTKEIEDHINLDEFDKSLPFRIAEKLSPQFIDANIEKLLKFRWSLFRHANIDEDFINKNAAENDWFQVAFNTQFNWSIDFIITHLDKFESDYGLSQNEEIYKLFFGDATKKDIETLLNAY